VCQPIPGHRREVFNQDYVTIRFDDGMKTAAFWASIDRHKWCDDHAINRRDAVVLENEQKWI
jgi:hypothetical protein